MAIGSFLYVLFPKVLWQLSIITQYETYHRLNFLPDFYVFSLGMAWICYYFVGRAIKNSQLGISNSYFYTAVAISLGHLLFLKEYLFDPTTSLVTSIFILLQVIYWSIIYNYFRKQTRQTKLKTQRDKFGHDRILSALFSNILGIICFLFGIPYTIWIIVWLGSIFSLGELIGGIVLDLSLLSAGVLYITIGLKMLKNVKIKHFFKLLVVNLIILNVIVLIYDLTLDPSQSIWKIIKMLSTINIIPGIHLFFTFHIIKKYNL